MKLGEKLQQLRKKSGLSQEQLAARLTVSRQAVSKWELDDAVPDTENVVQLSRLFGVSCDYLLREEVDEPDMALVPAAQDPSQPAPLGETHLNEEGWTHNARIVSLSVCAIGLMLALGGYFFVSVPVLMILGLVAQILGVVIFELAVPRMGRQGSLARLDFLIAACWLMIPVLLTLVFWHGFWYGGLVWFSLPELVALTLPLGAAATMFLLFLRRRAARKN